MSEGKCSRSDRPSVTQVRLKQMGQHYEVWAEALLFIHKHMTYSLSAIDSGGREE